MELKTIWGLFGRMVEAVCLQAKATLNKRVLFRTRTGPPATHLIFHSDRSACALIGRLRPHRSILSPLSLSLSLSIYRYMYISIYQYIYIYIYIYMCREHGLSAHPSGLKQNQITLNRVDLFCARTGTPATHNGQPETTLNNVVPLHSDRSAGNT